ncbi:FRG domain-containing protein [Chryseobacterium sp. LC2016-29]|uniref:FRG domain-containing protein n=1 Tax=Chryseobacterium sp. LC2016-29 TaxID=2897331 RepID=UPI001E3F093C|nr:FRG domain-containing protein [Chryseobacterium sp. LC2016-29]MCD0477801.1 FRG domain-containing protein [Chryseobacterium sp. LC2016-29]
METLTPETLDQLYEIINVNRSHGWSSFLTFFRGQIFDWPIKPNVTRNPSLSDEQILEIEKEAFKEFAFYSEGLKILEHFEKDSTKHAQDWHNLFQAQHLGLYTRLTDWTQDERSAMFFTIDDLKGEHVENNGVIWIYKCPYYPEDELLVNFNEPDESYHFFDENPLELKRAYLIKHYAQFPDDIEGYAGEIRRFRQDGSFIISTSEDISKPIEELEYIRPHLVKILIKPSLKREIIKHLGEDIRDYIYYSSNENNSEQTERIVDLTYKTNQKYFWKE